MLHFTVKFSDDFTQHTPYCTVQVTSSEGVKVDEYVMSFDDFVESIRNSETENLRPMRILGVQKRKRLRKIIGRKRMKNPAIRIETPTLPVNCVKHIWINRAQKIQMVFIEVPKGKWDIAYYNTAFEQVGFPRMLFGYRIRDGRIQQMHILAVKDKGRIREDTELYKFPYANVSNGMVCMGGNTLPVIKDLAQLATMHQVFFAAPSSTCYYDTKRNESGFSDLRELYNRMQGQDFPEEWLTSKQQTFGQYCQEL
jgi:hypothetical protein